MPSPELPTIFTPAVGYDTMRTIAEKVCDLLSNHATLLAAITTDYPNVGAALAAFQAACQLSNFRHVPEIQP